jgi:hypothetical protein
MGRIMRSWSLSWVVLLAACGGSSHPVCPSEKHLANPDGHGSRCVADTSSCDAPGDCTSSGACCAAACADSGGGVYACTEACREPDCTDGSCGAGLHCQPGPDECSAWCAPADLECPDGTLAADPTGSGQFTCVRADSDCFAPDGCPADPTGCCTPTCSDGGDGRYVCAGCAEADEAGADKDVAPECVYDVDCDAMFGTVGYRCVTNPCTGSTCVPPEPCQSAADCAWARHASDCCSCPEVVPRSVVGTDCWQEEPTGSFADPPAGAPPPEDCASVCDGVACPAIGCPAPDAIACEDGICVAQ